MVRRANRDFFVIVDEQHVWKVQFKVLYAPVKTKHFANGQEFSSVLFQSSTMPFYSFDDFLSGSEVSC